MVPVHATSPLIVAGGPGRIVALVLACGLGFWIARHRPSLAMVIWCGAVTLSLGCVVESVMVRPLCSPGLGLVLAGPLSPSLVK